MKVCALLWQRTVGRLLINSSVGLSIKKISRFFSANGFKLLFRGSFVHMVCGQ